MRHKIAPTGEHQRRIDAASNRALEHMLAWTPAELRAYLAASISDDGAREMIEALAIAVRDLYRRQR